MPSNEVKLTNHEIQTSVPSNEVGHVEETLKPNEVLSKTETTNDVTRRRSVRKIKRTEKIEQAAILLPQLKVKVKQDKCKTNTLRCCIKNCMKSNSSEISLHGLPNNKALYNMWMKNCKNYIEHQKSEKIKKSIKICGRHFEKHMFQNPNTRFRLIPSAVPTLFHTIDESKTTKLSDDKHTSSSPSKTASNEKPVLVLKEVHSYVANCLPTGGNINSTEELNSQVLNVVPSTSLPNNSTYSEQINKKTEDSLSVIPLQPNIDEKEQMLQIESTEKSTKLIYSIDNMKLNQNPTEGSNSNKAIDVVVPSTKHSQSVIVSHQPNIDTKEQMSLIESTEKSIEQINSINITKLNRNSTEGPNIKVINLVPSTLSSKSSLSVIPPQPNIDVKEQMLPIESTRKSIELVDSIDITKLNGNSTEGLNNKVIDDVVPSTSSSNSSPIPSKQINEITESSRFVIPLKPNINIKESMLPIESTENSIELVNSIDITKLNGNSTEGLNNKVIDDVVPSTSSSNSSLIPSKQINKKTESSRFVIPLKPNINIKEPMLPIESTEKSIELVNSIDVTTSNGNSTERLNNKVIDDVVPSTSSSNSSIVPSKQINKKIESSLFVIPLQQNINFKEPMLPIESTGKSIELVSSIDVTKSNGNSPKGLNSKIINVAPSTSSFNSFVVPSKQINKTTDNSRFVVPLQPNIGKEQMLPIKSSKTSTELINSIDILNLNVNPADVPTSTINFTEESGSKRITKLCFNNIKKAVTITVESAEVEATGSTKGLDLNSIPKPSLEIIPMGSPIKNVNIPKRPISLMSISSELPSKRRKLSNISLTEVGNLTDTPKAPSVEKDKPIHLPNGSCSSGNSPYTNFQELNPNVVLSTNLDTEPISTATYSGGHFPSKPLLQSSLKSGLENNLPSVEGLNFCFKKTNFDYQNVLEIHKTFFKVDLPSTCWKALYYSDLSMTMFFDCTKEKKVIFNLDNDLVPQITLRDKPFLQTEFTQEIKCRFDLEDLLVHLSLLELCYGYNEKVHENCIGYIENFNDQMCCNCQELMNNDKPSINIQKDPRYISIMNNLDTINEMNASRDRSINVQKSSAVQELKHFASRYSEHEVQSATETVFGCICGHHSSYIHQ